MKKISVKQLEAAAFLLLYAITAYLIVHFLRSSGVYPNGSNAMYHIYRGQFVYKSWQEGCFFPLLDVNLNNGVELLRYDAPLSAYVLAACQALGKGEALEGYLYFCALLFFVGAFFFLMIGIHKDRTLLYGILGLLFFFLPANLHILYSDGDLAMAMGISLLPAFLFHLTEAMNGSGGKNLIACSLIIALMTLTQFDFTVMLIFVTALFLILYSTAIRQYINGWQTFLALLLGQLAAAIWLVPKILNDIDEVNDSTETVSSYFQSILISLNPFYRTEVNLYSLYFGLALFALAVFGVLFGRKQNRPYFWIGVIALFMTTDTVGAVLQIFPESIYWEIFRFLSIPLCFVIYGFGDWKTLRRPFVIVFLVLLCLDSTASLGLMLGNQSDVSPRARLLMTGEHAMMKEAKSITEQRLLVIDGDTMEMKGMYISSGLEDGVSTTAGSEWKESNTAVNVSSLNKALVGGNYLYFFDRALEMGDDTILVRRESLCEGTTVTDLDRAAEAVGYEMVDDNSYYRLYHYGVSGNFGLVTSYHAIGIGTYSKETSMNFPAVEEATSTNLNDYTFDQLKDYDEIYLAGFTYTDKDAAEELVLKLSEAGVHIVISADGIPEERGNHAQTFLGVVCNSISFSQGYPLLETINGEIDADLFPQGHTQWSAVYVDGLDQVWGTVKDDNYEIPFYGTVKNDNIVVIGLNLPFYYSLTQDEEVGQLMSYAFQFDAAELPEREVVPLQIAADAKGITIRSDYDNVNTTLAYHSIFDTESEIQEKNHLLIVNQGETEIRYRYPYLVIGLLLTLAGIFLSISYGISKGRKKEAKGIMEND